MKFVLFLPVIFLAGCVFGPPPEPTMKTVANVIKYRVATSTHYDPPACTTCDEGTKLDRARCREDRAFAAVTSPSFSSDYEDRYELIASDGSSVDVGRAEYENAWVGKSFFGAWR